MRLIRTLRNRFHVLMPLPMAAAGVVESFCVIAVNVWMNNPTGFRLIASGDVVDVDPWAAMLGVLPTIRSR